MAPLAGDPVLAACWLVQRTLLAAGLLPPWPPGRLAPSTLRKARLLRHRCTSCALRCCCVLPLLHTPAALCAGPTAGRHCCASTCIPGTASGSAAHLLVNLVPMQLLTTLSICCLSLVSMGKAILSTILSASSRARV